MPKMNGEKFPYPKSGMQPSAQDKLNPPNGGPANIPGGVNDIYSPETRICFKILSQRSLRPRAS